MTGNFSSWTLELARLADFQQRNAAAAGAALARLRQAVIEERNVFEVLVDAVRVCSLGQITAMRASWTAAPRTLAPSASGVVVL